MRTSEGMLRLRVLGAVRGWRGDTELDLGSARQRATLAVLLAAAGTPVGITEFIDVLWPVDPPASAVNILQRHVGLLRRALEPGLEARSRGSLLLAAGGGYRLAVSPEQSDLRAFRSQTAEAIAVADTDPAAATRCFAAALALRDGPIAGGIPDEVRLHPMFVALEREYLAVVVHAADAALRAGMAASIAAAVQDAARANPLDESVQARHIRVLAATGRQTDAFEVHQAVRMRLADELGVDPGEELRAAHAAILRADTATVQAVSRPAQLPLDLSVFTGRHAELEAFDGRRPPPITTICGTAGVGKTTLAVHLAHSLADRFPDGQLYADLRGFDAAPDALAPTEALRGFIDAFGAASARELPAGLDALSALYRSGLAGKRVLVLLDNARDAEQVAPLLPGSAGCAAIVTSREPLAGLVARHGARPVVLGLLSADDARDLLVARLGRERVAAEKDAVDQIVELCSRLPLALATVAARVAVDPGLTLTAVADDLARHRGDLAPFTGPDAAVDVRAALSWSYRRLSPSAARLFRLLALHPCTTGGGIGPGSVAAIAGEAQEHIREPLAEICRAQLLLRPAPGRYSFHDLMRAYATELVGEAESEATRREVAVRVLDSACASLRVAHRLIEGAETVPYDLPGVSYDEIGDRAAAVAWFDAERLSLIACIKMAELGGFDRHVWWIAHLMAPYLERWGHRLEWLGTQEMALAAARRIGDPVLEAATVGRASRYV